jgi:hypothetical protein
MLSEKQKNAVQIIILILGGIIGWIFLSPLLKNKTENSILIGLLLALLINIIVFPDLRKKIFEQTSEKRIERLQKENSLGFRRFLFHITNLPLHIALLVLFGGAILLGTLNLKLNEFQLTIGTIIICVLIGLSGFLMLVRKEYVNKDGVISRGFWAFFNGILLLLVGWGSAGWLIKYILFGE